MAKILERSLYQTDYYAWTRQQAAALRALAEARVKSTLDLENLAEEVESLGRSDLATVRAKCSASLSTCSSWSIRPRRNLGLIGDTRCVRRAIRLRTT